MVVEVIDEAPKHGESVLSFSNNESIEVVARHAVDEAVEAVRPPSSVHLCDLSDGVSGFVHDDCSIEVAVGDALRTVKAKYIQMPGNGPLINGDALVRPKGNLLDSKVPAPLVRAELLPWHGHNALGESHRCTGSSNRLGGVFTSAVLAVTMRLEQVNSAFGTPFVTCPQ